MGVVSGQNNTVHPGEMQIEEDREGVALLFQLVNLLVENRISQPKLIDDLYGNLPDGARAAIEKRDGVAPDSVDT